ncbi:hypothetical protein [Vibrio parahaemolyticus]|uniref:hypothetical protein n=1 Tax=Vibrio parahaemolyticus TaxID=670 RepID=UPI00287B2150|nr:hypothetical protein [Vibrio parahaemolyticus]MDS1791086.1 hypothetical protein [Vibrio parahaemolyticus]
MLRGQNAIKYKYLNSFIDTLTMSKIRYLVLYSKESNVLSLNGSLYDDVRNIYGEDLPLLGTDANHLDNLVDEEDIEYYKSKIYEALFKHSNVNKIIDDFNAFYEGKNLVSRFIHKFSIRESHLEENARLIYWLWGYIQKENKKIIHSSPQLLDKYNDIISHLSNIDYSPGHAVVEIENIYLMYKNNLDTKNEVTKFLNKEKCDINFLKLKSDFVLNKLFELDLEQTSDILRIFSKEIHSNYYVCVAMFDLIQDVFLRENLIYRLSRKWSDKKHREKMKEKNIIKKQISINKKTSNKLSKIEEYYRCNSSEAIARTIEKEYDQLFK